MNDLGGILDYVGRTPLVKLNRVIADTSFELYAKLEMMNPGGSSKDRPALRMMVHGLQSGAVKEGTTIIESSSGNLAISLAQICAYLHVPFICVIDPKTTQQNVKILRAFHAQIELVTEPDEATGEYLPARIKRVKQLIERYPDSYWPNQYGNLENAASHYHTTMKEIIEKLPRVDYLFCGVSTCGTIRGCCEYIRDNGLATRVIAVDAKGSAVFSSEKAIRLLPGLGAAVRPALCPDEGIHDVVHVTDRDCIEGCHSLAKEEAILAGGSSGGVLSAVQKYRERIEEGAICVAIFPDRGERYLDTIYSAEWLQEQLDIR